MSENAPGQLLGYTIQYPRALCHLLKAGPGSSVCIEVHGDVSTLNADGTVHAEEDKSSINSNPVTDKSTDLWKTLSNWVDSVISGELNPDKTTFILYRNKSGRTGLVEAFDQADSIDEAKKALEDAKERLDDVNEEHAIWRYYSNAAIQHEEALVQIIKNFRLETGSGAGYSDVELGVRGKHVAQSQVSFVIQNINGWIVKTISERISEGRPALVTWEEFDAEFRVLFSRARRLELIDFTIHAPPSSKDVTEHVESRATYIRQVQLIGGSDDELIEAATHYLKAKINRDKWIAEDVIDEHLAADFEERLRQYWSNRRRQILVTGRALSKQDRGQLLKGDCMIWKETIRGESPPASTIAGTYHALADVPALGWHEDWELELKK